MGGTSSKWKDASSFLKVNWLRSDVFNLVTDASADASVIFHCDHVGATQAWTSRNSRGDSVLDIKKKMAAAENNFTLTLKHIADVDNRIVDSLSRFHVVTLAPLDDRGPQPLREVFPSLQKVVDLSLRTN